MARTCAIARSAEKFSAGAEEGAAAGGWIDQIAKAATTVIAHHTSSTAKLAEPPDFTGFTDTFVVNCGLLSSPTLMTDFSMFPFSKPVASSWPPKSQLG